MAQAENAKKLDYTPVTYDDQYILMVNQLKKYFPIKGEWLCYWTLLGNRTTTNLICAGMLVEERRE